MDVQAIWLLVLAISAPIGGVIGFFLQLRQLNQAKLQNDMYALEITELKRRIQDAEQVIVRATPEEIKTYGKKISEPDVLFSRGSPATDSKSVTSLLMRLWISVLPAFFVGLGLAFFSYLVYDLYRIGRWILMG